MNFRLETSDKLAEGPAILDVSLLTDKGKPASGQAELGATITGNVELITTRVGDSVTQHTIVNVELKPLSATQDFGINNGSGRLQFSVTDAKKQTFTGSAKVDVAKPLPKSAETGMDHIGPSHHTRGFSPVLGRKAFDVRY